MAMSVSTTLPAQAWMRLMHRIGVPDDLGGLVECDAARERDPLEAGMSRAAAASVWGAVEDLYRTGYYPAVLFCLRRNGHIVFNRAIGHARGNGPEDDPRSGGLRAGIRTPSCLFSASKAITAMVLHRMEERGDINLLNPISLYIPEFGRLGKERTTIYHLLSHRAGIPGIEGVDDIRVVLDHAASVRLLCDARPRHLLGRRQAYHAITGGVILGELVRRVSGMDIRTAWRRWFKEPMGLKVLDYGASERIRARVTEQVLTGMQGCALVDAFARRALGAPLPEVIPLANEAAFYRAIIPAGNMVSTAEEASAFYQMLLDGGRWNGRQILRPETVHRATMEVGPHRLDATLGLPMRYSQGFMLGGQPFGIFGPRSHHAFGHIGLVNNITWADPSRGISVALLVNGIPLLAGNLGALLRLFRRIAEACPEQGELVP